MLKKNFDEIENVEDKNAEIELVECKNELKKCKNDLEIVKSEKNKEIYELYAKLIEEKRTQNERN